MKARTCELCGDPLSCDELKGRCVSCARVHATPETLARACVHPTLPFARDPAAQRFVEEHPAGAGLEEIGDALGVTKEAIRNIEVRALTKLRRALERAADDDDDDDDDRGVSN